MLESKGNNKACKEAKNVSVNEKTFDFFSAVCGFRH